MESFLFCNIYTQIGCKPIRKEYVILLQIFSVARILNIIKNILPSNHRTSRSVFSSCDEFLVSAVVVPVSVLTIMLYANLLAQTISEINKEYWN